MALFIVNRRADFFVAAISQIYRNCAVAVGRCDDRNQCGEDDRIELHPKESLNGSRFVLAWRYFQAILLSAVWIL